MFEKALITRAGDAGVDLGTLAETILFYGTTHLLLNRATVVGLAQKLPAEDLLALLDRGEVRLSYLRPSYAVATADPFGVHRFVAATLHANADDRPRRKALDHREEIDRALRRALGDTPASRKLGKQIGDRVALHTFKRVKEGENVIVKLAERDICDPSYLQSAARTVLEELLPPEAVPGSFKFSLIDTGSGYLIDTDLDYAQLNSAYHQRVPPTHSTLNDAYLLSHVITSCLDSYFAAEYMAELVTTPLRSKLIRLKHFDILRARDGAASEIDQFRDVTLPGFPSIRDAMNSGERSVSEFLRLLDKAEKFREWLRKENPDRELLAGYVRAATEDTWADTLPTRTARWAIFTAAGAAVDPLLGTAAGAAIGAFDTFVVDRFLKGWRPSHFIEGPYKEFVTKKGE